VTLQILSRNPADRTVLAKYRCLVESGIRQTLVSDPCRLRLGDRYSARDRSGNLISVEEIS
jgi:hypothetical protein